MIALYGIADNVALCMEYDTGHILISANAEWRYQAGFAAPEANWQQPEFDDARWRRGKAGFGYGDHDDRTYLKSMRGRFDSVRIRHRFVIDQPDTIANLFLYVRFDDAFIAYLNGHEVTRSGVRQHNGRRTVNQHEAKGFQVFSIVNPSRLLREGVNVLAMEGFNRSIDSSDFSLHPVLTTVEFENPELPVYLTREELLSDLNYLEQRLEDQSSYLLLAEFDYQKAFDQLRDSLGENLNTLQFAQCLQKIIVQIGDAHAEVKVSMDAVNDRYLPFIVANSSAGFVAVKADRKGFMEEEYPVIKSIDGKSITYWLDIASRYVVNASPQLILDESLRELRSIDRIRVEDGNARTPFINITLQTLDGDRQIKRRLNTSEKRLHSGKVVLGDSRVLEGNIGYLRISSMWNSGIENVFSDMSAFRDTNGLIIDVRDNRGGRYEILRALYGYFVAESAPPYVANIAAYRLSSRFEPDHLHYRPTYRLEHSVWTAAERRAIEQAIARFEPEWRVPKGKFSAWHFMVLRKSGDARQYHYRKPVVVLSNARSFSAADGFLSSFSDLPGVTILGQASAGGSGATQYIILPNSGIKISKSSMVSFRPDGKLFDGNGIEVDVAVMPLPSDFLGRSDAVLDRAVDWIEQARAN
jgi:hypothetical protein